MVSLKSLFSLLLHLVEVSEHISVLLCLPGSQAMPEEGRKHCSTSQTCQTKLRSRDIFSPYQLTPAFFSPHCYQNVKKAYYFASEMICFSQCVERCDM
jgi:hypothetical protein